MTVKKLPFVPFPRNLYEKMARPFRFVGSFYDKLSPSFKTKLYQAEIDMNVVDYIAVTFSSALFFSLVIFVFLAIMGIQKNDLSSVLLTSATLSFLILIILFSQGMMYPYMLITKKTRMIERNLLFALKYLLIKLKSGVPIYDAFVGVAESDFGAVSDEFKIVAKEMAAGLDALRALENLAVRSASPFLRRTIWQITNNVRSGSEITDVLESITSSLVREQKLLIRKYGAELNPVILMYMMMTVVVPSLGITVLMVMSSFAGLNIPQYVFYIIPIAMIVMQFFFITIVKNKRPMLSV